VGSEQRRHARYPVHLRVQWANAESFAADYAENLSIGGIFVAGAQSIERMTELDVTIELPGGPAWTVRARVVFQFSEEAAAKVGRRAGAGMELVASPPGFADAQREYVARLASRRDVAVMLGACPGRERIADAGYQIVPLVAADELAGAVAHAPVPIVAVVVERAAYPLYAERAAAAGAGDLVFAPADADDAATLLVTIDALI
jgi:type IV pilus assembly protein PilZ